MIYDIRYIYTSTYICIYVYTYITIYCNLYFERAWAQLSGRRFAENMETEVIRIVFKFIVTIIICTNRWCVPALTVSRNSFGKSRLLDTANVMYMYERVYFENMNLLMNCKRLKSTWEILWNTHLLSLIFVSDVYCQPSRGRPESVVIDLCQHDLGTKNYHRGKSYWNGSVSKIYFSEVFTNILYCYLKKNLKYKSLVSTWMHC